MATKNTLSGGGFQDALGSPVANGYMLFVLSQDSQVNSTTQIGAGFTVKVNLDSSGNIISGQTIWPNDVLAPTGTFYNVSVYSAVGQLVWGPNAQQVLSTPSPFDVGAWVPAAVNIGLGGGGGVGTVNSFSFTNANGFTGVVTNPTTIPNLTLTADATFVRTTLNNVYTGTNEFTNSVVFTAGAQVDGGFASLDTLETSTNGNATSGANLNAPTIQMSSSYWDGTGPLADKWEFISSLGTGTNPTTTFSLQHAGSPGVATFFVPNLNFTAAITAATATAGSATLPANPLGFWEAIINGTTVKIPYYSA